jgi:hypothetical protein
MPQAATKHLQVAYNYIDSMYDKKRSHDPNYSYQGDLDTLAAATKHLHSAQTIDPKAKLYHFYIRMS